MDFLCEHVVPRKRAGLYRFAKAAIIAAWILVPAVLIIVCMGISTLNSSLEFLRTVLFLIPVFVFLAIKIGPITAAYGDVSYEYSIVSGEMEFAKIFGDRFRRKWFTLKLQDVEIVAPYSGLYADKVEHEKFDTVYKAISSFDAPYIYYGIWTDEDGRRCIVFFEAVAKSLKMIKTYNKNTIFSHIPV